MYNKNEKQVDFSDKIAISKMTKEAVVDMEKSEAMKFNVFLKECIPTKSGTDKEKFGSCLMEFKKMKQSDAGRPGPKSGAQTPAKPDERKKGSKVNPPGSAGTKTDSKKQAEKVLKRKDEKEAVAKITFSEKTTTALKNKVSEHNKKYSRKVTLGQLKKVYRRGAGAFSASHRPGQSRNSWAMARVNMFLKMMRGGKVKDAYRKADRDIAKASEITHDAEGQKRAPLNKPFRTPKGPKKFAVYVKNEKDNVVMVRFGDPNMEIKRDDPDRRKNFRARHNCDNPGPKTKARYWSCKMWEAGKSVTDYTQGSSNEAFYADFLDLDLQDHILEVFPEYAQAEVILDPEEDKDCGCGSDCNCQESRATHDGEIRMLKAQLKKTQEQITETLEMLEAMPDNTDIEAWLQSKITKISDYTNSVHGYMKYYEKEEMHSSYNMDDEDIADIQNEASQWSMKYKKSIDCDNPKGFSQKQYCERQKRGGAYKTKAKYEQMFNDLENK
jgi:hypothetical protein|tara:strand:+ start:2905 stop:4395 length:1491 start_codon:yes stop_codon:yes gene_type:complete